jgi:molybdate transport system regulatory protein
LVPRLKLWLERDGRLAMSDYRVRLLELVAETGSLSGAATTMGLSYRRAWGKVKDLEAALGFPLLESRLGGFHGGGSVLTKQAVALVAAYRRFQNRMAFELETAFRAELEALQGTAPRPQ